MTSRTAAWQSPASALNLESGYTWQGPESKSAPGRAPGCINSGRPRWIDDHGGLRCSRAVVLVTRNGHPTGAPRSEPSPAARSPSRPLPALSSLPLPGPPGSSTGARCRWHGPMMESGSTTACCNARIGGPPAAGCADYASVDAKAIPAGAGVSALARPFADYHPPS